MAVSHVRATFLNVRYTCGYFVALLPKWCVYSSLSTSNMAMGKFSVVKETFSITGTLTSTQTSNSDRAQQLHS